MNKTVFQFALVFIFTIQLIHAQTPGMDWPMVDGFSERTGHVDSEMTPPFELKTSVDVGVNVSEFSFVDGIIYCSYSTPNGNAFRAYDPMSNRVLWDRVVPRSRGGVNFVPAVSDDIVYIGGQGGTGLYALNRMTGDSIWFYANQSLYGRNVAIKGDKLFLQPPAQGLVCLDKDTGEKLWEFGSGSAQTVPLVDDRHVYFTSRIHDTLFAVTHDGEESWKYLLPSEVIDFEATMSIGDTILVKTRTNLIALDQSTGQEIWNTTLMDSNSYITTSNALTYTPKMLIVHEWIGDWSDTFMIQGFDYNGNMIWNHVLEPGSGGPAVSFGNYLTQANGGDLEIRHAMDGNIVQEFEGLNLRPYTRVKVVDDLILAAGGSLIHMFTPITTHVKTEDDLDIKWDLITNPVKERLTLRMITQEPFDLKYRIHDLKGVTQGLDGEWQLRKGINLENIDISNLPSGQYVLTIKSGKKVSSVSFIKT